MLELSLLINNYFTIINRKNKQVNYKLIPQRLHVIIKRYSLLNLNINININIGLTLNYEDYQRVLNKFN